MALDRTQWRDRLLREWGSIPIEKRVAFVEKAISVIKPEKYADRNFQDFPNATKEEMAYYLVRHPEDWPGN